MLGRRAQDAVQSTGNRSLARDGKLVGAQATQSALLMRIDDLIIAEWTENGSIRIWMEGEPGAPELYAREYDGAALRSTGEAYRHMGSEYGTWQSRVARHIEMFTGLRVTEPSTCREGATTCSSRGSEGCRWRPLLDRGKFRKSASGPMDGPM